MSRHLLTAAVVCSLLSACGRPAPARSPAAGRAAAPAATADAQPQSAAGAMADDLSVAAPVRHANLTIFPVISKSLRADDRFITLAEGLRAGTVEIREMGSTRGVNQPANDPAQVANRGTPDETPQTAADRDEPAAQVAVASDDKTPDAAGDDEPSDADVVELRALLNDVNRLVVINRSDKPLYLMPGEIIVGGSQDRTIGEELVIAPTGEPVPINVFCVEHGRWGARDLAVSTKLYCALHDTDDPEAVAHKANQGEFVGKAGNLGKSGRVAVQCDKNQQKVWDDVELANRQTQAVSETGAFTANFVDGRVVERLKPYQAGLERAVSQCERIVGVVVAINGKIETVDVFESTPLFLKLWPALLKGYAVDAVEASDGDSACQSNTADEAAAFLASVLRDQESAAEKTEGGLIVSRHETNDRISFSAGVSGIGGGMGAAAPVHAAGFAK